MESETFTVDVKSLFFRNKLFSLKKSNCLAFTSKYFFLPTKPAKKYPTNFSIYPSIHSTKELHFLLFFAYFLLDQRTCMEKYWFFFPVFSAMSLLLPPPRFFSIIFFPSRCFQASLSHAIAMRKRKKRRENSEVGFLCCLDMKF